MRIGLDARVFVYEQYTGISWSVNEILSVWKDKYPENEYFLLAAKPLYLKFDLPENWHIVNTPWIIESPKLWSAFKLPQLIEELDLDVYWGTNFVLPRKSKKTKYVVTVYDLAIFKFRGIGSFTNTLRLKLLAKSACKKADCVVTISNATAEDVQEIFGIESSKIKVSYCGGLPSGFSKVDVNGISENDLSPYLRFDENFFLFISTIEPRKNIVTIVKAFEKYVRETNSNDRLVLAGKKGWKCKEIFQAVDDSPYKERIIMPGFISDKEKAFLLSRASAFVYPSLYEGFGIPILEAMEYDLPVITSRVSSMPEVGGNAACYIDDPLSVDDLTDKMIYVKNMTEAEKNSYNNRMEFQRKKFSWIKNGNEMMEIIKEVADIC